MPFTDDADMEKFEAEHGTNGELIRCNDCKYSVDEYGDGDCYCDYDKNLSYIGKNWNHYCGFAERKEECFLVEKKG